jgi:hypothetical protein
VAREKSAASSEIGVDLYAMLAHIGDIDGEKQMAKRTPYRYCVLVEMMRRDTAATLIIQMNNIIFAEDVDEAKEIALVECAFSAAENLSAWEVLRFDVRYVEVADDAAWA